ncbi:hypothetical protein [Actinokineospora sp. NBRC 105648]|uniref:aa3-type cytochrome oxidase subunit CtaJ n=1 Tax=Actinokineospora sp. NBRC 105648 TaxID=3032206 RepID=UPI0024A19114|nr:hypothetical protein [Actinokineospora sp. NBRC 105648]GLZ37761.1 hypothetical protein Acsp05_13860 [Actinokineospora sp. NBRC 105648]
MTLAETLLVFAAIPLALYGVIALLTLRDKFAKAPRYRPGQEWGYEPVWWTANPAGLGAEHTPHADHADTARPRTAKGGARGGW